MSPTAAVLEPRTADRPAVPTLPPPVPRPRTWLVGPAFDLFLVANLFWPLLVLLATDSQWGFRQPLSFVQIYFLSTPHRWITLLLVFLDRDQFGREPWKFLGLGAGLIGLGLALAGVGAWRIPGGVESLVYLMMLDFAWNSWHFAAQHAGIYRIYGRMVDPAASPKAAEAEKAIIRLMALWTFCRIALYYGSRNSAAAQTAVGWNTVLAWLDPVFVLPAWWLVAREAAAARPSGIGRWLYLTSVTTLYTAILVAFWVRHETLLVGLFLAHAVFHANEYLAVVSWAVHRKTGGVWRYVAPRAGLTVLVFALVWGSVDWMISTQSLYAYVLMTLLVSLLHYAYDGMIWRARPKLRAAA